MESRKFICTYFNEYYLPRGLALFRSVRKFHENFVFYVLAFDDKTYDYIASLDESQIELISANEYNRYFSTSPEKFPDKKQYFFSATSNLCTYILEKNPSIDILLYLDADTYLFNPLESLYYEFGNASVGLTEHRVNPFLKLLVKHYGKFVIGVNLFRNDQAGRKCLKDWKEDCDNWYPGKPGYPLNFFSDQIFLDSWPEKYEGIKIIRNIGVNTSYWNASNYRFQKRDGVYFVNETPLMIYHFSSLKKIDERTWNSYSIYGFASVKNTLKEIYVEYIKCIESFGVSNSIQARLNHQDSLKKKIAHRILRQFINEIVIID